MLYKEIKACRVCGNPDLESILDLGVQSLSGRFPEEGKPDSPEAPLELVRCTRGTGTEHCGLVQLRQSVIPDEMYSQKYGYRSGINQTMRSHLEGIVAQVRSWVTLEDEDAVLDIGSNDCTLLRAYADDGLRRIGIDPTGEQFRSYYPESVTLISDYFSATEIRRVCPDRPVKAITSISMFYDLPAPMKFVADIRSILSRDGVWILEQSYLPTMLEQNSFDTICHEHLEYYCLSQIAWILSRCQMQIIDVEQNAINGGSFRVSAARDDTTLQPRSDRIDKCLQAERELGLESARPYREFGQRVETLRQQLCDFLKAEKDQGKKIYIYGASTKGNVLLQYYQIGAELITAAADRNPEKWGARTPATRIPIISEDEARRDRPDYFLVLPWHFKDEFLSREAAFLAGGGKFIFPLPELEICGAE